MASGISLASAEGVSRDEQQSSMRILHVIPNIERGGAERAMIILARGAADQGHEVAIVILGRKNAYADSIPQSVPVEMLGYPLSYRHVRATARCLHDLRRSIREFRPDLVHSHLWPAARMVGWAVRGRRIPHVVHIHDTLGWLASSTFRDRVMRVLTRHALCRRNTHFIAVARAVREYTRQHLSWIPANIPVIYNAVDTAEFAARNGASATDCRAAQESVTLGVAYRLVPNKGIDHLLRAMGRCRLRERLRLRIAGEGSAQNALQSLVRELGLQGQVEFLGTIRAMAEFYKSLDCFVLPSLSAEGLPLVLLEAMACGLPVVATDVAGAAEAVRHRRDGLVVPPGDEGVLAAAIDEIASSVELRRNLGASAAERARKEFNSEKMVRSVLAVYVSVLGSRKRAVG